jgi:hypothetical protein
MPTLSEHDDDPQPDSRSRALLVPILIVAAVVVFVLLHLTGIVGAGSH